MSLETVYDRRITIINNKSLRVTDKYGNEEEYEETRRSVRARRNQKNSSEIDTDRNQQTQRFDYIVPANTEVTGRSKVIDGDLHLEVVGEPDRVKTQLIVHHIQFEARAIEG